MDNGNNSLGNSSDPEVSDVERVLVPIFDTLILVTGVVGHCLVIVILVRIMQGGRGQSSGGTIGTQHRSANGTDILLLSLSVADLLLLVCLPFHTYAIATRHWSFGNFMCKIVSFLGAVSTSASAFTLATLAFMRYITVVHPTKAYRWRRDSLRLKVATGVLWIPAVILAVPQLVWRTVRSGSETYKTQQDLACFNFLSETDLLASGICHFLLAFVLPLGIIVVAYGKIYCFLRKTRQGSTSQIAHLEQYQRQVTQTSALLVLAFALCWLPSYGLMFAQIQDEWTVTGPSPRFGPFATFARIMATSSTVVNPILYVFMSQKFRKELIELGQGVCKKPSLCEHCQCIRSQNQRTQ
ncbi:delta-type opioid receptor-like [Chanos chanos]|uniref:Delta-type opioid receptor-like n=1 Tax=Chanos chanos TaxID=29144 RepID=A0A6J2VNQ6_CHACN|nr:delta-type opioid receptor-like [Chanos chanos]